MSCMHGLQACQSSPSTARSPTRKARPSPRKPSAQKPRWPCSSASLPSWQAQWASSPKPWLLPRLCCRPGLISLHQNSCWPSAQRAQVTSADALPDLQVTHCTARRAPVIEIKSASGLSCYYMGARWLKCSLVCRATASCSCRLLAVQGRQQLAGPGQWCRRRGAVHRGRQASAGPLCT